MMADNPPAFAHGNPEQGGDPGMSLRDYFAGQALVGLLAANAYVRTDRVAVDQIVATSAYVMADAMLAARKGDS